MWELQEIQNLPKIKIMDMGDAGVKLYLKKILTNENSFSLIENFVRQRRLGLTDSNGYYIIGSANNKP